MIRAYSQRLLPPYSGMVLIAESERARAQSFDGLNWEIQYLSGNEDSTQRQYRMQDGFPTMLVREDWAERAHHDLCQRYLMRKAPRLLMLQSLSAEERSRLEMAARPYVLEVDQYYPLYPAVNDQQLMNTMRVEARLRRASPQTPEKTKKDKDKTIKELDKSMRIIEN